MKVLACPDDDLLAAYFAGEVSASELEAVSTHLETCQPCLERLDQLSESQPVGIATPELKDAAYTEAVSRLLAIGDAVRPGMMLRDYRLQEKIGEGGMGSVFKAVHERLEKTVALKVIRHESLGSAALARFQREMRAVGRLRDPHIVQATDAGEVDGVAFLVMEYVEGQNLSKFVKANGALAPSRAFELIRQAAKGLQHAHDSGLIHRDVKPSNLMLTPQGNVKILDLGLAVIADEAAVEPFASTSGGSGRTGTDMTSASRALGTFDYMAPEQKQNAHAVDARADVYGLGATLWYLLTGKPVPAAWEQQPTLPGDLPRSVWSRWLAQNPADRFATVAAAADSLKPQSTSSRFRWLAAAIVIPFAIIGAWQVWKAASASQPPAPDHAAKAPDPGAIPFNAEQAVALQKTWADWLKVPTHIEKQAQRFALIPPGEVHLGGQMMVTITKPFWLGTCEVTHEQFDAFVKATKHVTSAETHDGGILLTLKSSSRHGDGFKPRKDLNWRNPGHDKLDPKQPVTQVSWRDAVKYCEWLTSVDGGVCRLPSEAEMHWAHRAGDARDDPVAPPKSDIAKTLGWHRYNAEQPMPVGQLKANPWGLHDLFGNVSEHVRDRAAERVAGRHTDYAGPNVGDECVFYGFAYLTPGFKYNFNDKALNYFAFGHVGFRVLREVDQFPMVK